jgi:hypothetical protein
MAATSLRHRSRVDAATRVHSPASGPEIDHTVSTYRRTRQRPPTDTAPYIRGWCNSCAQRHAGWFRVPGANLSQDSNSRTLFQTKIGHHDVRAKRSYRFESLVLGLGVPDDVETSERNNVGTPPAHAPRMRSLEALVIVRVRHQDSRTRPHRRHGGQTIGTCSNRPDGQQRR